VPLATVQNSVEATVEKAPSANLSQKTQPEAALRLSVPIQILVLLEPEIELDCPIGPDKTQMTVEQGLIGNQCAWLAGLDGRC
jgi:hypothetical protein